MNKLELMKTANEIRKGIVTALHSAKAGHPGGSLSATEIFTYLYFEEMNIDPDNATQTHPKLLLTQICMNAFKRGTDGMYATKKVIQADGESADQYYKWTRGSFGYYDNLRNVQKMGEEAERVNAPVYTAVSETSPTVRP